MWQTFREEVTMMNLAPARSRRKVVARRTEPASRPDLGVRRFPRAGGGRVGGEDLDACNEVTIMAPSSSSRACTVRATHVGAVSAATSRIISPKINGRGWTAN